jgi:hypothetical protein
VSARGRVDLDQFLVALQVQTGVGKLRLVARLGGLRLLQLRLERARVDLRQHLTFLDVLAFDEANALELPIHAA